MTLQKLKDQMNSMTTVQKNQIQAMVDLNKEDEINTRLSGLNEQIRQNKAEIRQYTEKYNEIDRQIQASHRQIYDLEDRFRQIQSLMRGKKKTQIFEEEKKKEKTQEEIEME